MLLKFALKDFYEDRKFKNVSPKTMATYKGTLDEFQTYCSQNEVVNAEDVTPSVIKSYLLYCRNGRGNKPASINHKLHNLKVFLNYIAEELKVFAESNNPVQKIPYLKQDVKIEVFSDEQINQMFAYYRKIKNRDKTFYAYRDFSIKFWNVIKGVKKR